MAGGATAYPRTVEDVFTDFKGRRTALIKALTADVDDFFKQCDPEKDNLCLYGYPSKKWEVTLPAEEVPAELPEPALGINFARDGMKQKDWLTLVAVHCDSWLHAVAFYFGAKCGLDKDDRKKLFNMMNDLPTVVEVLTAATEKPTMEKSNNGSNKSNSKQSSASKGKHSKAVEPKDEEEYNAEEDVDEEKEEEEEEGETLCGTCGDSSPNEDFWICCDVCEKWYHGKCVKITPSRAANIKQYKCPSCSNKRARP